MSFIDKAFLIYMTACILALVFVIAKIKMVRIEIIQPEKEEHKSACPDCKKEYYTNVETDEGTMMVRVKKAFCPVCGRPRWP